MQLFLITIGKFRILHSSVWEQPLFFFLTWKCPLNASVHIVLELLWKVIHVVECVLFYCKKVKNLILLKTPTSHMLVSTRSLKYFLSRVILLRRKPYLGNRLKFKNQTAHFWPGLQWCFLSSLQNFGMLERRSRFGVEMSLTVKICESWAIFRSSVQTVSVTVPGHQ